MKSSAKHFVVNLKRASLKTIKQWVIEQAIAIQQIPAPTFEETERANYVAAQFRELGLEEVQIDDMYNVLGVLAGTNPDAPGVMVMAHTDTVFPADTDLTIRKTGNLIYGPGLGDNSMGVAGILGMVKYLKSEGMQPATNVWIVATTREEGLGDLGGARLAFETLQLKIGAVINVEGLAYGYVYHAGITVRRLHITAAADGGHSWLHFGRGSAIHAIMQLGNTITQITPPESPRTTYNIGMIEGGQSINSIASQAGLWLDLRSEDGDTLQQLEDQVRQAIEDLSDGEVRFNVEIVGDRPAGRISENHPMVNATMAILNELGVKGSLQIGSTDGNIPLSNNCPTVTIGITRGGHAHRLDEFVDTSMISDGLRQLIALTLAVSEHHAPQA